MGLPVLGMVLTVAIGIGISKRRGSGIGAILGFEIINETADDAGVVRVRDDLAIVTTVDFFPPMVDDPSWFGRVGAANSLSDVYAMGGEPVSCVCVYALPNNVPDGVPAAILQGAVEKCEEAGAPLIGGHTVVDTEIKFGLAVTGTVHPDKVVANAGARPGDKLVLTKPPSSAARCPPTRPCVSWR